MPRLGQLLIVTALVLGAGATLWGLSHTPWQAATPLAWDSPRRYVVYLIAGVFALRVLSSRLQTNCLATCALVAAGIALLTGAIWPLAVTLWFAAASYILGRTTLGLLRIDKDKVPGITVTLVGAAVYGTVVGIAAHFPINYPGLYAIALAAPIAWGWREACAATRSLGQLFGERSDSTWLDLAIGLIALVHYLVALMPEVGHDALAMHLFIPGHLATRHQWGYDVTTYVWAVMPMLGDWLFSIAYLLAGETAARMMNVGFIFALSWLVRDLVLWAGGSLRGARWAVLLFLTTPLTFTESSSLFIESVWAALVVAGALSLFRVLEARQSHEDCAANLKVAGVLLGAAAAAKAVTLTILPALLLLLLMRARTWGQRAVIASGVTAAMLFLVVGGIPYVTAWHLTGNPVFPFFNQVFQSPLYPTVNFDGAYYFGKGLHWDVLYQVTFRTEKFMESRPGGSGFQWILLFCPALLALLFTGRRKAIVLLALAGVSIALAFHSVTYLRYVFPEFAWVCAGIGAALSSVSAERFFVRRVLCWVACATVALNLVFFKSGTYYGDLQWQALMSSTDRENYLSHRLPIRSAVEQVNRLNMGRAPVAVFSAPLTAGLASDGLYPNWYNHRFQGKVTAAKTAREVAQLLLDQGVQYVILDSGWGETDKRKIIEEATDLISEHGSIAVRQLSQALQYQTELLVNSQFSSLDGWVLSSDKYPRRPGLVTVSVSAPAVQSVAVAGGRRYQNSVTAYCTAQPTQGRVQVNWQDAEGRFLSTDIKVFDCTYAAATYTLNMTAPPLASTAFVYATAHTDIPINISMVSFKQ